MNKWFLILICINLASCSGSPKIEIRESIVPIICDTSPRPDSLDLKDTPPTLVEDPDGTWGYWFSPDLYGAMAENIQAMRRWMKQSSSIRNKLIQCIDQHNAGANKTD